MKFKFVKDINEYVEKYKDNLIMDEFWAQKIGFVKAVAGEVGQKIVTYTKDGIRETENIVRKNEQGQIDFVVTNSFGETYIVDYNTFNLKYEKTETQNIYKPISNPIRVVRCFEDIEFKTNFNELFRVKKDDYLIIPYNRHIYGITKESLYQNYTFIKD